jgi:hypothetical protein
MPSGREEAEGPPPFLLEAMKNSLAESSIMECSGDGGPLCGEPTKVAP